MANILKPKRSNVPGAVPTTTNLADGEIAVNTSDRRIFVRVGAAIVEVANRITSLAWSAITGKPETATRWPTYDEVTGLGTAATQNAAAADNANTVVLRDAQADIHTRLFRMNYGSNNANPVNFVTVNSPAGGDNYLRPTSVAFAANAIAGEFTADISVSKSNAWLSLDSPSVGDNGVEQAAGISIGENGYKGNASLHITYTGDGRGHIGMGAVDPLTSLPANEAMRFYYTNRNVDFLGAVNVAGEVTADSFFNSSDTAVGLGTSGAGTVYLRPNGKASTTGQFTVDSTGASTSSGTFRTHGNLHTNGGRLYFDNAGDGHIVGSGAYGVTIRPKGWSTSGQTYFRNNGDVTFSGIATGPDFSATSDRRLKDDIRPRKARQELLDTALFHSFLWKSDGRPGLGVIAQEVQALAPEYVHEDSEGTLSVDKASLALEMLFALVDRVETR